MALEDTILNFLPYIIVLVGIIIGGWIGLRLISEKFKFETKKRSMEQHKKSELDTIAGKVEFAIHNTELAYKKLSDDIKGAQDLIKSSDPKIRAKGESIKKGAEQQLKIVEYIMKNKQYFDYGGDLLIPLVSKLEKKFRGMVKGGMGGMF